MEKAIEEVTEKKDANETPDRQQNGSNRDNKVGLVSSMSLQNTNYSMPALDLKMMNSPGQHPLLPTGLLMGSPYNSGSPSAFAQSSFTPIAYSSAVAMVSYSDHMQIPRMPYITYQMSKLSEKAKNVKNLSRTIYLGNLVADVTWEEIFSVIKYGPIESSKYICDKSCVFISFLDHATASAFYQDALEQKLLIRGQEVKTGWGKSSLVPTSILKATTSNNASRNVYLGGLSEDMTTESLNEIMTQFGIIEKIDILPGKQIAFLHYISISMAIKAVETLRADPKWSETRISYGRDHCAKIAIPQHLQLMYRPNIGYNQQQQFTLYDPQFTGEYLNEMTPYYQRQISDLTQPDVSQQPMFSPYSTPMLQPFDYDLGCNMENRTIYFGNLHASATLEDICNVVRGGMLQHVRYLSDRHIAFITFLYPANASFLFQYALLHGIFIQNRRVKVGWGKNPGPLPTVLQAAVNNGATRNVYVGYIDESITEDWLRDVFLQFGDIEMINTLREKSCAFVNFTSITAAIKAVEGGKNIEELKRFRIYFGKDRCANKPKLSMLDSEANQSALLFFTTKRKERKYSEFNEFYE